MTVLAPGWRRRGWIVLLVGFLPVAIWALLLMLIAKCQSPGYTKLVAEAGNSCLEFWFNRYQTFIAGVLAITGALATIRGVRAQIADATIREERRRSREELAARAVLPLALSSLIDYAETCLRGLRVLTRVARPRAVTAVSFPALPQDIISPIRDCIRSAGPENVRGLADLLDWVQVQHARLRDLEADLRTPRSVLGRKLNVEQAIIDAAELYHRASDLFSYGRRSEEGDPPRASAAGIRSALRINRIREREWPGVFEQLARRR
jgi:hypothetical protein